MIIVIVASIASVGVVVVLAFVAANQFITESSSQPGPDASEAFVSAFQRSLEGTYAVRATYSRVLDDGRTLRSDAAVIQRPPDSLHRQFGGLSGTVDGRPVSCSTNASGTYFCGPSGGSAGGASADGGITAAAKTVATQIETLRSYFQEPALYRVTQDGADCFDLTQQRAAGIPPYGSSARFCFDQSTGAIRLLRQNLEGAVDTFEATSVRSEVADADLSLNDDPAYRVQADAESSTTLP